MNLWNICLKKTIVEYKIIQDKSYYYESFAELREIYGDNP